MSAQVPTDTGDGMATVEPWGGVLSPPRSWHPSSGPSERSSLYSQLKASV